VVDPLPTGRWPVVVVGAGPAGALAALDDFGSGYSSLRYLASMPVDLVKFDISMIHMLLEGDSRQRLMLEEIAGLVGEGDGASGGGEGAFLSAFSSGATVFYVMDDGAQQEWGLGTVTSGSPNTLARTTVIGNSLGKFVGVDVDIVGRIRFADEVQSPRVQSSNTSVIVVIYAQAPRTD
jgi:hypothetical protein